MKIGNGFSMERDRTRMIQLDILRGVAILLVLFTHNLVGPQDSGSLQPVLNYLRHLGPTGVDLFFVLSGFLVGGLLFKELRDTGHLDVGRFLIRRGFKIWPSYFVFIGFVFLWLFFIDHESLFGSVRALLPNLFHVQNYFGSPREHTWSLAVEEHFYLALPFLLLLLTSRQTSKFTSIPALPYIAVSLFILCALFRIFAYADRQPFNPHFATHLRIDSLFFGVMLAYFYHFKPQKLAFAARHRGKLICFGTVLLLLFPALVIGRSKMVGPIAFVMLYVAYGCFLLAMIYTQVGSGRLGAWLTSRVARAIAFIGFFSYPMYLWHIDATRPVAMLLKSGALAGLPLELRWLCAFVIYVLLALTVAVPFGILLDRPSLALRDRLFPAKTGRIDSLQMRH